MAHSAHDIKKHVRGYWIIGFVLYVATVLTVTISKFHLPTHEAIALALLVAVVKGTLVALYFMHLIDEKKVIYAALALTVAFFALVMAIPVWQFLNVFPGILH